MGCGTFLFLDSETTGLAAGIDEMLEIAIVDIDGHPVLDTLVRPVARTEWPDAQALHRIAPSDVLVDGVPTLDELRPRLRELLEGSELVIYNAPFDLGFLGDDLASVPARVWCAMRRVSARHGEWSNYWGNHRWVELTAAAELFNHDWSGTVPHRALGDALACRSVWLGMEIGDFVESMYPPGLVDPAWWIEPPDHIARERRERRELDLLHAWPPVDEPRPPAPPETFVRVDVTPGTRYRGWTHVPKGLAARTWLRRHGLRPVGEPVATVHQRQTSSDIELYRVVEAQPIKPPTDRQRAARAVGLITAHRRADAQARADTAQEQREQARIEAAKLGAERPYRVNR